MARAARKNRQYTNVSSNVEIIKALIPAEEKNMNTKQKANLKFIRRGIVKVNDAEYYFSANTIGLLPVVFGAQSLDTLIMVRDALNNNVPINEDTFFSLDLTKDNLLKQPTLYLDEIDKGTFIVKHGNHYFGYMMGAAGCRAVSYRKGASPYSCAVKSLIKYLEVPGKQPFRKMEGQGERIREEMIPKLMKIVKIIDERCSNNKGPDGSGKTVIKRERVIRGANRQKKEEDASASSSVNNTADKEIVITNDAPKQTKEIINTKESYCGCCNKDTTQKIVSNSELQCEECGERWERFDDEPQEEQHEEIIEKAKEKEEVILTAGQRTKRSRRNRQTTDKEAAATKEIVKETKEETMEQTKEETIKDTKDEPKTNRRRERKVKTKDEVTKDAGVVKDEEEVKADDSSANNRTRRKRNRRVVSAGEDSTASNVSNDANESCHDDDASADSNDDFDYYDFGFDY